MMEERKSAPVKRRVVLVAAALTLCAAALVCALLYVNATTLRGTVSRTALTLTTPDEFGAVAELWSAETAHGVLKLRGALARRGIGAVDLRVGLIWKPDGGVEEDAVTLLNTQMVRVNTADMGVQDADDHCGFVAAVKLKRLPHHGENGQYRAVLVSEGRLIECSALGLTLRRQGESWAVERKGEADE